MKKLLKSLFLILGLVFSVTAMTACSDDDEGGLSGVYGSKASNGYGYVYHFINGNTVRFYAYAHYGWSNGDDKYYYATTKQIDSSNWYASEDDQPDTFTYEVTGNKVIIPRQGIGTILTISGNTLIEDGGLTYIKD